MSNTPVLSAISSLRREFPASALRNREGDLARWRHFKQSLDKESGAFLYAKFVETFCDQQNYPVPVIRNTAGLSEFCKDISLADIEPDKLLEFVNPKKIKKEFVKKTGIEFRTDDQKNLIVDAQLVSDLVQFFDRLQPLKFETNSADYKIFKGSSRYWVVSYSETNTSVNKNITGKIVRFTSAYEETEEQGPKKDFAITIINDLASCLRGRFLERASAEREVEKTIPLATEAAVLSTQFWSLPTIKSEGKSEGRKILLLSSSELREAADSFMKAPLVPEKRKAQKAIRNVKLDNNPPARGLQFDGAQRNLRKRVSEINSIAAVNERDILHLRSTYLKAKQVFESAQARSIKTSLGSLEPSKYAFFNSRHSQEQRLKQLDNFLVSLSLIPEILERLNFRPFKTFADTILDWRKQTQQMIRSENISAAREHMQDLAGHIKVSSIIYTEYLTARHLMNGSNAVVDGKAKMLSYLDKLKQLFKQGYLSSRQQQVSEFLSQIDEAEANLLRFEPPKRIKPLTYMKKLSDKSDIENFLSGCMLV